MTYITDADGTWLVLSPNCRALVEPSVEYEAARAAAAEAAAEAAAIAAAEDALLRAQFHTMTAVEVAALPPNGNGPLATVKAILAKQDADITSAEVKTLVLLMARYFLKKWLAGWR